MIMNRLNMIFTQEELSRLIITETNSSHIRIVADVHGMKCFQVKRFIRNIINTVRIAFKLTIIHGYNHGTAIKDMLSEKKLNYHIVDQSVDFHNPGVTYMTIAV